MGNCLGDPSASETVLIPEETGGQVLLGHNCPLVRVPVEWSADVPITEGQLRGKRDTFWETAPVYEGRKEIWDALRAAVEAAEEEDYDLAQAILSGANVSLQRGQLTEAYDELGNRYVIPKYCLSKPTNLVGGGAHEHGQAAPRRKSDDSRRSGGTPMTVKVRMSTLAKDAKVTVLTTDRIRDLKRKLEADHGVEARRITMLYSGRVLNDSTLIKDLEIPKGFVIQAVVVHS